MTSLLDANLAERNQLARDRENYKKKLKFLKNEQRTFREEQSEFANTKADWVENTHQRDSSSSSDNFDSNASTSSRSSRTSHNSRNSRTTKSTKIRDGMSYKLPTSIPKFDGNHGNKT